MIRRPAATVRPLGVIAAAGCGNDDGGQQDTAPETTVTSAVSTTAPAPEISFVEPTDGAHTALDLTDSITVTVSG